jgi:hypothetical protein
MAAHRIVLVNRSGDELFWGSSVLDAGTPSNGDDVDAEPPSVPPFDGSADEEPCPATLRSSVFVRAEANPGDEPASSRDRIIEVTMA